MRILGLILRTLFLLLMVAITARVASPQSETFRSAWDTPSDLVRIVLGAAACLFITVQIFRYSRDPVDMRSWVMIGGAVIPLALLCAHVIW
jgi:hypothetical protein